jgi:hypothetical protein
MSDLEASVDRIAAETRFSGVVRVDRGGDVELAKAYGLAHRDHEVVNAGRHAVRYRQWNQGTDRNDRDEPDRRGTAEDDHDRAFGAGGGYAADRRRGDGRAPACSPIGHR